MENGKLKAQLAQVEVLLEHNLGENMKRTFTSHRHLGPSE